jgi:hypothetical protein
MTGLVVLSVALALSLPIGADDTVNEPVTQTTFDKTWGDPPVQLYGVAPRKKVFFKVYGVGLYADRTAVDAKLVELGGGTSKDKLAQAIIASDGRRVIVLKFVRDLSKSRIQGAFREGIEKTIRLSDTRIADDAKVFLDAMRDIKKGDVAEMVLEGDGSTTLIGNSETLVSVNNRTLGDALLAIYIGSDPIAKDIKEKLLSLN